MVTALQDAGVTIHGDAAFGGVRRRRGGHRRRLRRRSTSRLDISARVVADLDDAIEHIHRFSSHHTDAIVTEDQAAARRFVAAVDSAAVLVNASTRFTDGGEFGFGAEIGISTQKLHARGPMGLPEMTTTKYVVTGDGHVALSRVVPVGLPAMSLVLSSVVLAAESHEEVNETLNWAVGGGDPGDPAGAACWRPGRLRRGTRAQLSADASAVHRAPGPPGRGHGWHVRPHPPRPPRRRVSEVQAWFDLDEVVFVPTGGPGRSPTGSSRPPSTAT